MLKCIWQLLLNRVMGASVAGQSLCTLACIFICESSHCACVLDSSNALPGMQVDGLRCDMAGPGDVAALEDFSREALGTVQLWCVPGRLNLASRKQVLLCWFYCHSRIALSFHARDASLLHRGLPCW